MSVCACNIVKHVKHDINQTKSNTDIITKQTWHTCSIQLNKVFHMQGMIPIALSHFLRLFKLNTAGV